MDRLQAIYRKYSRDTVYSYEEHVELVDVRQDFGNELPGAGEIILQVLGVILYSVQVAPAGVTEFLHGRTVTVGLNELLHIRFTQKRQLVCPYTRYCVGIIDIAFFATHWNASLVNCVQAKIS